MTDDVKQAAWESWIENHPVTRPARWAFDAGWDAAVGHSKTSIDDVLAAIRACVQDHVEDETWECPDVRAAIELALANAELAICEEYEMCQHAHCEEDSCCISSKP